MSSDGRLADGWDLQLQQNNELLAKVTALQETVARALAPADKL